MANTMTQAEWMEDLKTARVVIREEVLCVDCSFRLAMVGDLCFKCYGYSYDTPTPPKSYPLIA